MKKISFNEAASKNVMTASQMKQIKGGSGTCGYYRQVVGGPNWWCGVSKEEALKAVSESLGGPAYWCCDSCGSTSYCG